MTQTVNIFYLHEGAQFDAPTIQDFRNKNWFHREFWSFERTAGIYNPAWYDTSRFKFNIVNNNNVSSLVQDAPTIIPCDIQSRSTAQNNGAGETKFTEYGDRYRQVIESIAENPAIPNKIFLIYSCAEPHFYGDAGFVKLLASKYPDCKFVASGSGIAEPIFDWERNILAGLNNTKVISRQWYFEQVHERTFVDPELNEAHIKLNDMTPPPGLEPYAEYTPRFILTMKNIRLHRAIASYYIENDRSILDTCVYSRNFSADIRTFIKYERENNHIDYVASTKFYLLAIRDILDEPSIPLEEKVGILKQIHRAPHKIDLKSCQDDQAPSRWLYNGAGIALVASGEAKGWGFVDEKPAIAIMFQKPFLYFGSNGLYEELEQMGFKTFGDYFDLSYGKLPTCYERVHGFYQQVAKQAKLDEWNFWSGLKSLQTDVDYNYNRYVSGEFKYNNNNKFFEELLGG